MVMDGRGTAASFVGMWVVMMLAMMLPSLVPMPWRHRRAVGRPGEARLGRLTALVGVGYFFVWTAFGRPLFRWASRRPRCVLRRGWFSSPWKLSTQFCRPALKQRVVDRLATERGLCGLMIEHPTR